MGGTFAMQARCSSQVGFVVQSSRAAFSGSSLASHRSIAMSLRRSSSALSSPAHSSALSNAVSHLLPHPWAVIGTTQVRIAMKGILKMSPGGLGSHLLARPRPAAQ